MPRKKKAETTRYRYSGPPHVDYPDYGFTARGVQVVDFANCVGHLPVPPDPQDHWTPTTDPATLIPAFNPTPAKPVRTVTAYTDRPAPEQMPLQWHASDDRDLLSFSLGDRWLEIEAR